MVAAVPATSVFGVAVTVHTGGEAGTWHANQLPAALVQAASMDALPLVTRRLTQRLLLPAPNDAGAAGTGPDNWLLRTSRPVSEGSPLRDGMEPVN